MAFLKNRKTGNNDGELDLKEGISKGMKNIKQNAFGVGSHRVLQDSKYGLQQKVGTAASLEKTKKEKEL